MVNEETQKLAERIALLLRENEKGSDDFSFLRASLEKINARLDKIESQISSQNSNPQFTIGNSKLFHPSREKFALAESVAPEINQHSDIEKACPFEPSGKPCDYCAMCSSRGF